MAILKLQIDDFDEIDYDLIAIHSVLEDYRLAYLINQKLPVLLNKSKEEVEIHTKEGDAFFSKFTFSDFHNDVQWTLIPNKNEVIVKKKSTGQNLFLNEQVEIATKIYLLSELKKVDYFLKIENNKGDIDTNQVLKSIQTIDQIAAVYIVNPEKIKSKNNLIF